MEGREMGSQTHHTQQSEAKREDATKEPARRDEFMSTDDLGRVIDDLRSGRRPALLEDQEP